MGNVVRRIIFVCIVFTILGLLVLCFYLSPNRVVALKQRLVLSEPNFTEQVFLLTNQLKGTDLIRNENLEYVAKAKLDDIIKNGYWSHYNQNGDIMWGRDYLDIQGEEYTVLAENLSYGYRTPEDTVSAWKESPTHYKNIMDARFTDIGIACENVNNTFTCVQRFSD